MRPDKVYNFFWGKGYTVECIIAFQGDVYTIARAVLLRDGIHKSSAEGVSKRSPLDKPSEAVGGPIAMARALDALYKKYTRKTHRVHQWYHG